MPEVSGGGLNTLRVDQVGGLVGPQALLEGIRRYRRREINNGELAAIRDEAIRGVLQRQASIGIPILTDGELRRENFQESFGSAVSGYDIPQGTEDYHLQKLDPTAYARSEQDFHGPGPAVLTRRGAKERLKLVRNVPLEEYRFAAAQVKSPVKVTLIGPDRVAQRFDWEHSKHVYADLDAFVADVVAIQREMIRQLVAAGCRYIQIDAPGYTAYVDPVSIERMRSRGEDPERNLRRSIAADNALIEGFDGVTFGIHICRGNPRTRDPKTGSILPQWHREGHYDAIAEQLFGELKHQRWLLEYDSERAGSFEPLRFIRKGAVAVLGLVTTKNEAVEEADTLKRRIDAASRVLPLEQLAVSPQCGFGSAEPEKVMLPEEIQWKKFERLVEVARDVWR